MLIGYLLKHEGLHEFLDALGLVSSFKTHLKRLLKLPPATIDHRSADEWKLLMNVSVRVVDPKVIVAVVSESALGICYVYIGGKGV